MSLLCERVSDQKGPLPSSVTKMECSQCHDPLWVPLANIKIALMLEPICRPCLERKLGIR